jgi:photosystem II stability/assembly factor-like uncharacterized protein
VKRASVVFLILVVMALTVAAAAASPAAAAAPPTKWTIAIYGCADNDLDYAWPRFSRSFIEKGIDSADVNVVAMVDRFASKNTKLYKYDGAVQTTAATYPEKDFGSGTTFKWFLNEVTTQFPSDHLMVVMWDHGYGWRYIAWDQHTNNDINMPELRKAIVDSGKKIDILGFDACNMGMADVAYELGKTDLVDYLVGSEETIDQDGWPYDGMIDALAVDPDQTPETYSAALVDAWTRYYRPLRCFTWVSLSAIDVAKFETAVPAIQAWTTAMDNGLAANRQAYRDNLDKTIYGWECYHVDMAQLGENIAADATIVDADLKTKSAAMAAGVRNSVVKISSGTYADEFSGLALWWGEANDWLWYKDAYRTQPAFAKDLGWYAFLKKWNAGPVPPWPKASSARLAADRPFSKGTRHRGATARAYPDPHIERARYGLTDVAFADANHGWAVGYNNVTNNAIALRTTDGGVHWTTKSLSAWYAYQFGAIKALDIQNAWAVGSEGWPDSLIEKTTTGGASWKDQASKTLDYLNAVDFINGQEGWVAGTDATLLHTTDGGAHWTPMTTWTTTDDFWGVDFTDATHGCLVGGDRATRSGFIRTTTNGGATWDDQMSVGSSIVYSVSLPGGGSSFGYAVGGDAVIGAGSAYYSTDGGTTWTASISSAPANWLCDVTSTAGSTALLVGDKGMLRRTTDNGETWSNVAPATGPGIDTDLTALSFTSATNGWMVGDAEEIWHTTDGGDNWTSSVADVTGPACRAWNASVRSGKIVQLKYRVDDDMSTQARATIKVYKKTGKLLRTMRLSWQPTGFQAGAIFTCKLKPGRYPFKVYAIDEATNPQTKVGKGVLTVR